jgi:prepilin-type processing-associated H-X9-DG protein
MNAQPPVGDTKTLEYAQSAQKMSGQAVAALVFGILAIVGTLIVGLGCLFAPIAVLLGISALGAVRRTPHHLRGRGVAWAGVIMGLATVPLAIAATIYVLAQARELNNRAVCAINLRTMMQALENYATANGGDFPVLPFAPYGGVNAGTSTRTLTPDATTSLQELFAKPGAEAGSPLASVWILALDSRVNIKPYTCPSTKITSSSFSLTAPSGDFYANIQADDLISYSFAYPYTATGTVGDWWKTTGDASLPLAADIAPLAGMGKPKSNPAGTGPVANSGNHMRDGQNVAFADGHVEFARTPQVGHGNDNIYTLSGAATPDPVGTQPLRGPITGHGGTPGAFDVVMVPARNLDTGKLW